MINSIQFGTLKVLGISSKVRLDQSASMPLYRQLADSLSHLISIREMQAGERLPATRELAGQLGLNRTTVSAAYALLEQAGLIRGHVGRGSFVNERDSVPAAAVLNWEALLPPLETRLAASTQPVEINFASARPARDAFPLTQFRRLTKQVVDSPDAAEILQLGSPHGYAPLRRYLLEQSVAAGIARPSDDLIVTNGCQQALDLLARLFTRQGEGVVIEDPVYYGLSRIFSREGATVYPVPVDDGGIDATALESVLRDSQPRLLALTPSFQNPTGATLSLERRKRIVDLARRYGVVLIENDIYSELRYQGTPLPTLKQLDETGNTILLRSYSKVSFPGLRVGWITAPRAVIARLAEAKQTTDLHSDQLSQAVLLRFAESGELGQHLDRTRRTGLDRLKSVIQSCSVYLPPGSTFTRPEGGMNLWVELPAPLLAEDVLARAQERGVTFLPGRYFSGRPSHRRGLRLSFGGLPLDQIVRGIKILGEVARHELDAAHTSSLFEPAPALV